MKILLDDFGMFLGRRRGRFSIRGRDKKLEVPVDDVEAIICTSQGVAFSSSALKLAVEHGVQIIFAGYRGWPYAVLMPTSLTGSVRARREQFKAYSDARGFTLARAFVLGKILNQASLLKLTAKNRRDTDPMLAEDLYEAGRSISRIADRVKAEPERHVDEARLSLMNLEAEAARTYWSAVKKLLPEELGFPGRETRGAKDPFNAMLNFGYQVVLFPEAWKAVSYAGLDPYAGYLHADRPGKPSLVLDIMEEFRQQVVDRTLLALVSKRVVKPGEIIEEEQGQRLIAKETARKILEALEERLDDKAMFRGRRSSIRGLIQVQARNIARLLLDGVEYRPFTLGW
ncbi:MAG: CRISPR-associated endonuclease Cas1 [Candidatus Bathyarchaeia archaeon]